MRQILIAALLIGVSLSAASAQDAATTSATEAGAKPVAAAPASTSTTTAAPDPAAAEAELRRQAQQFYDSLHRQTGAVTIAGGKAVLNVPASHYFLGPEDSRRVIVDVWQNPPEAANGIEGMLFEDDANPMLGAWGAVVEYDAEGYVSDSDASSTNYTDLLHQMQQATTDHNAERQRAGFPAMTLVGWAEPPHYDARTHTVYWAKELASSDTTQHALNYDIRVLGRAGVLSVNFVAGMEELQKIKSVAPEVMAIPQFTEHNRYADYQEGADPRAAYGIAGLIAGGAALAVAQKTGLIALILLFAKKFIVVILAGAAGLFGAIRRFFGGKKQTEAGPVDGPPPAAT